MTLLITSAVLEASEKLSRLAEKLDPQEGVEGFHLTLASRLNDGSTIEFAQAPIGTIRSPYGATRIRDISSEKALRLASHRIRDPEALSSWQTRDPERNMYQGAVLFPCLTATEFHIISVSAYKEPIDEAVALIIGQEMGLGNRDHAKIVAQISRNQVYDRLLKEFYV